MNEKESLTEIRRDALRRLREAALDGSYVSMGGRRTTSVHEFYRYPARFSPQFARAAIEAFTHSGDLVFDPFVGGGTTLVEARLLGRLAVGNDLNPIATFVTRAKTAIYDSRDLSKVRTWAQEIAHLKTVRSAGHLHAEWTEAGYLRMLADEQTWRLRNLIAMAIDTLQSLTPKQALLARCAILRAGQWALDMRQELPSVVELRDQLRTTALAMADVAEAHAAEVRKADRLQGAMGVRRTRILQQRLPGLAGRKDWSGPPPRLILTSPPYPGVYVLYHRWKLQGRKEIPAPFWIVGSADGQGHSYYTMRARATASLDAYFDTVRDAYADILRVATPDTWIVQMVGFNDAEHQLPRFLDVMRSLGLREMTAPELGTALDGRLWRQVPGRRWWVTARARRSTAPHTSNEVVLVHRPA